VVKQTAVVNNALNDISDLRIKMINSSKFTSTVTIPKTIIFAISLKVYLVPDEEIPTKKWSVELSV
jgi:chromosome condensin MukBEF complex kleisin-like MukF subunit